MANIAAQVEEGNARNAANETLASQRLGECHERERMLQQQCVQVAEALAAAGKSQAEALQNFEGLRNKAVSMAAASCSTNKGIAAKFAEAET